jgi:hypothetical protein
MSLCCNEGKAKGGKRSSKKSISGDKRPIRRKMRKEMLCLK